MTSYLASGYAFLKDLCSVYAPRAQGGRRRAAGQSRQTAAGTTSRARQQQPRPAAPPGLVRRVWGVLARAVSFGGGATATSKGRGRVAPCAANPTRKHTERNRSQMRTLEADLDDIKREIQVIKKEKREKRVRIMSPVTEPKPVFSMGALESPMATKSFAAEDSGSMTISSLSFLCEATSVVVVRKPSELMVDA